MIKKIKASETKKMSADELLNFAALGFDKETNESAHADMETLKGNKGDSAYEDWTKQPGNEGKTHLEYEAWLRFPAEDAGKKATDKMNLIQREWDSLSGDISDSVSKANDATKKTTEAIGKALETAEHPTFIGKDNYVYQYNFSTKKYDKSDIYAKGDVGKGFKVLGYFDSLQTLQDTVERPEGGDVYGVGSASPYDFYIWDGINDTWVNNGKIQGIKGESGKSWRVPDIDHKPGEKDLIYIEDGKEYIYPIGAEVRYLDEEKGYTFYKLYNIIVSDNNLQSATWGFLCGIKPETVKILVASNQSQPDKELNNVAFKIKFGTKEKVVNWQGQEISIQIPAGLEYSIECEEIEGYSLPAKQSYTATEDYIRNIYITYNTTITTINILSNQPVPDININNVSLVLRYGTFEKQFSYTGNPVSINIPTGKAYTLEGKSIVGYKTPSAISDKATGTSTLVNITYLSEKLFVNASSDKDIDVSKQVITITDIINNNIIFSAALNTTGIGINIPFDITYQVEMSYLNSHVTPEKKTFVAGQQNRIISFHYIYIISSRIIFDDRLSDPANITGDVNGEAIQQIRSKFKRCLVKKTAEGEVTIRYLKSSNSNFYDDDTPAILTGEEGDVMVYFPNFYYKYEKLEGSQFAITFSLNRFDPDCKLSSDCLVGAYLAHYIFASGKYYSYSGVSPYNSYADRAKEWISNRGKGYQLIDYEQHKMIAWLFFAIYGTRDCQSVCGRGSSAKSGKITGSTNNMGNNDTAIRDDDCFDSVNFLGLEDCWGSMGETLANLTVNSNGKYEILDMTTNEKRTIEGAGFDGNYNFIRILKVGEYLDVIPTHFQGTASTYYCDTISIPKDPPHRNLSRGSSVGANYFSGVTCINRTGSSGYYDGVRIAFRGTIKESGSVAIFKALPIID